MSLHRLSLTEMSRLRARQKISASELLEAHLAQIDRTRAAVNPFTALYADQAHAEAANPRPGKLSGIPVTIKDSFDLSGEPTHCGSRFRLGHRATRDSAPAARLRAEGAIILGKTNTPEFLANYESDNHLTGRTNNPWNLERTAGGSSGGEAAAIASHCSPGG
ncbi:MAG: amidase, partial [Bryobacteraceae bacterium]|nr:amidase [Bryobacteraceae bacterium]